MILLPDATLQYRPDIGAIIVRWSKDSTPEAINTVYSHMLETATEHKCYRWLLDVRRRDMTNAGNNSWVKDVFLPGLCNKLQASVKLAYVLLPTVAMRAIENPQTRISTYHGNHGCHLGFFDHEAQAYDWLEVIK